MKKKLPPCGFFLDYENGKLPIKVLKRAKGKRVTVIGPMTGDVKAALIMLQAILGVGGTVCSRDTIEVQGDQEKRVVAELIKLGAAEDIAKAQTSQKPVLSIPDSGISSFLKRTDDLLRRRAMIMPSTSFEVPPSCKIIHGDYWPYCIGNCHHVDLSDVFIGAQLNDC